MTARSGTVGYWLGVGIAVALIAAAMLWNAWTFNQHSRAQRQLDALNVDSAAAAVSDLAPGSPEAAELEMLLDADRRGILEENFLALLTDSQKRALIVARRGRLEDKAGERNSSLVFGGILILVGLGAYGVGRRTRRSA